MTDPNMQQNNNDFGILYWARTLLTVKRHATGCTVRGLNPVVGEIFCTLQTGRWAHPSFIQWVPDFLRDKATVS